MVYTKSQKLTQQYTIFKLIAKVIYMALKQWVFYLSTYYHNLCVHRSVSTLERKKLCIRLTNVISLLSETGKKCMLLLKSF